MKPPVYLKGLSRLSNISEVMALIYKLLPLLPKDKFSLLDLGCGKGMYGIILHLHFLKKIEIIGVDVKFDKALDHLYKIAYKNIFTETIQEFVDKSLIKKTVFDTCLGLHVFEHLKKEESIIYMEKLKRMCTSIILAFPRPKKGHVYDTKDYSSLDKHRWGVNDEVMQELGYTRFLKANTCLMYYYTKSSKLRLKVRDSKQPAFQQIEIKL